MKKILYSLGAIGMAAGVVLFSTGAFFSDTEATTGNTFTAGAIDLKIDNVQHYNGMICAKVAEGVEDAPDVYQWVPENHLDLTFTPDFQPEALAFDEADATAWNDANPSGYPKAGTVCDGTWPLRDLVGEKFFNFTDLKPGDFGENTISLHVDSNDAWACLATSNVTEGEGDPAKTEPEEIVDPANQNPDNGELLANMQFFAWEDDGDNIYEVGEGPYFEAPVAGNQIIQNGQFTLADSGTGTPLVGGETAYVGVAWCFGQMGAPVAGQPLTCDGSGVTNASQTDTASFDVTFTVEQSRNNPDFLCEPGETPGTTLTLVKNVVNGESGTAVAADWMLSATGPTSISGSSTQTSVTNAVVTTGVYTLAESGGLPNYVASAFTCVDESQQPVAVNNSQVTIAEGQNVTCTVVNTYAPICTAALDLMLVMDNSTSINGTEEDQMQAGAVSFITALPVTATGSHAGLVSFATNASLTQALTGVSADVVNAINAPFGSGSTNLESGILAATTELGGGNDRLPDTNGNFPDVMVIITDGNPNLPTDEATGRANALAAANAARAAGIEVYVVGVGADVDATYLQTVADPGKYFSAANFTDVEAALLGIVNCGPTPSVTPTPTVTSTPTPTVTTTPTPTPTVILAASFGAGASTDIPEWSEDGEQTQVRAAGSGNDSPSPDGGSFVVIDNNASFCRTINAVGFNSVMLSYFWRGDADANHTSDDLLVEIKPASGNSCNDNSGWTQVQNHDLQSDASWTSQAPFGNAIMNNSSFLLRFRTASEDNEFGRVDGISVTGTAI